MNKISKIKTEERNINSVSSHGHTKFIHCYKGSVNRIEQPEKILPIYLNKDEI